MSDSAELKNMLSAQYNFILNTHVVNKVQLLLLWSDARFKIKVAKQIATSGLRRCKKKTQILIDYQSRTEFKTRLGQKKQMSTFDICHRFHSSLVEWKSSDCFRYATRLYRLFRVNRRVCVAFDNDSLKSQQHRVSKLFWENSSIFLSLR